MTIYYIFILFYALSVFITENKYKYQNLFLILSCIILTLLIGARENWADQAGYLIDFENAPLIWDLTYMSSPSVYVEKGYFYLASLIKTIYNDSRFYFLTMGGISMFLLYKSLKEYCIFPLIGLCDYIGRFLINRDFIQMRSSLTILLIILAIKFIHENKAWKYFITILIAYQFHHMALLGIPLYFLYKIKITKNVILIWIFIALILSQTLAVYISGAVNAWSEDLNYQTYTKGIYVEEALGLANPMIYFQIAILLLFTYKEETLKFSTKYYYLFRTGYFYSTIILIFFCDYWALSGRTATMFATLEMFMLPLIAKTLSKEIRYIYYTGLGFVFFYFFINYRLARLVGNYHLLSYLIAD